ncbi:MAG: phosphodiester glycosidase family protein [Eubacteriales bacterium]|nr:phosphodiester glycosidase family protein [Eubacteriales bacterium]
MKTCAWRRGLCLLAAVFLVCRPASAAAAENDAAFLFNQPEEYRRPAVEGEPWVYASDGLTVCVRYVSEGKKRYYAADIVVRTGGQIRSGFAFGTPPGRKPELPEGIARRSRAVLALTGDFLCHHSNPKGAMVRGGKVYYDEREADVLAVLPSGELAVYKAGSVTAQTLLDSGVSDSLAFGPIVLQDGVPTAACREHALRAGNLRTAVGRIGEGHYLAVATTTGFTFPELAALFAREGCTWAYNLDGGHSCALVMMGEQLNAHAPFKLGEDEPVMKQRPLPDMLIFGQSGLCPAPAQGRTQK